MIKIMKNKSQKILIVEDEEDLREAMVDKLTREGFQVDEARNGEEGLEVALRERPDLILLDLILPKKDGFAVLKELKDHPETSDIPVIVLTNLETARDVEKILSLGATTYLVKVNYDLADIVKKVKDALKQ